MVLVTCDDVNAGVQGRIPSHVALDFAWSGP